MSAIQVFGFPAAGITLRVVVREGEPWFVAADVCRALEIGNTADAVARLDADEKGVDSIDTPGGRQTASVVSEAGLYSLILGSRKPEAREFKRWVTHHVLPAIRRTGSYGHRAPAASLDLRDPAVSSALLVQALQVVEEERAGRLLAESTAERLEVDNGELRAVVEVAQPKAEALDRIATFAVGSLCVTDAAKVLQVGPRGLFRWLSSNHWIYRRAGGKNWLAYQNRIQQGVLEHKVTTRYVGLEERVFEQVLITPKGLAKIAEALSAEAAE